MPKRLHRDYTEDRLLNGQMVSTLVERYDDDRCLYHRNDQRCQHSLEGTTHSDLHAMDDCPFGSIGTSTVWVNLE